MTNNTERFNKEITELDALIASLIEAGEIEAQFDLSDEVSELSSLFAQADAIMSKEIYCD